MMGGFIYSAIVYIVSPSSIHLWHMNKLDALYVGLAAVGGVISTISQSVSLQYAPASKVSPILYLIPVFSYTIDVISFDYSPTVIELLGCGLIMVAVLTPTFKR